jgi:glucose-6-phosphate dehydrogenase assembly protein OpcA
MSSPAPATKSVWTSGTAAIASTTSHVCFSNLLIYTEDPDDQEKITEIIAEFVIKHPCRTILIFAQPKSTESKLEASLFTHTSNPKGNRKIIACDQINLKVSGASVKEIPSAVQPLLVPDLPVYLWWRGVFLPQKLLLEQMLAYVNRFIYDGVTWTDLHYTVPQVSDLIQKHKENVGFSNFNWSRLRPWREYSADFFDSGIFEQELYDINRVRVEFMALPGQEEGYQYRALLFVAWLAVQLDWEPVQGKPGTDVALIQFKNSKGEKIETELVMTPQSTPTSRGFQKVVMGIQKNNNLEEFIVQRDHDLHLMTLSHKEKDTVSILRKVPHIDSSAAELLYRELGRRIHNRVFEKSFGMASRLFDLI